MKVGVITFHRAANYGAILQSYALTQVLRDFGENAEIIDYRSSFIEEYYDAKRLLLPKNWKRLAFYLIKNGDLRPNKERFYGFLKENNVVSNEIKAEDLSKLNSEYDCFLAGSDQIWNYSSAGFDKNYFLQFVENCGKKKSYAASFGFVQLPDQYKDIYISLLKDFRNISVREKSGRKIVQSLLHREATVDVDPTILLNKNRWEEKCGTTRDRIIRFIHKPYVLVYMISENMEILKIASKIAKDIRGDVLYINDRWKRRKGVVNLRGVTVEEWLLLFSQASFIVTNSFHGVAFSINMNKQFVVVKNKELASSFTRIDNILSETYLLNRLVADYNDAMKVKEEQIEYDEINRRVENLREQSIKNLCTIVHK